MTFCPQDNCKTVEELGSDPRAVLAQAGDTGKPVTITVDGKPNAVVLPVDAYERLIHTINLARALAQGQDDIRAGRTQPLDEWMKEFERANNLPSRDQRQRRA